MERLPNEIKFKKNKIKDEWSFQLEEDFYIQ